MARLCTAVSTWSKQVHIQIANKDQRLQCGFLLVPSVWDICHVQNGDVSRRGLQRRRYEVRKGTWGELFEKVVRLWNALQTYEMLGLIALNHVLVRAHDAVNNARARNEFHRHLQQGTSTNPQPENARCSLSNFTALNAYALMPVPPTNCTRVAAPT